MFKWHTAYLEGRRKWPVRKCHASQPVGLSHHQNVLCSRSTVQAGLCRALWSHHRPSLSAVTLITAHNNVMMLLLTSTVNGENPGSRPRCSMHTSWTTPQSDNRALLSLDNNGLTWTVSAPDKVTAVPVRRNGNFQTPISVPAVRPKQWHTLSNPAHIQVYTVACRNYTPQMMMPLPGWPAMAPKCIRQQQQLCKNSRLFTLPVGILFFTYKICCSHSH